MDRRAPDLDKETPDALDEELRRDLESALRADVVTGALLSVEGRAGKDATALAVVLGDERHAHEIFVFARGKGSRDRAVDYLGGVVDEVVRTGGPDNGYYLPLDWEGRPFDGDVVFVRGEVRDYVAEEEAARLLEEPPPPRGLRGTVVH
jgi:hypothetical protein